MCYAHSEYDITIKPACEILVFRPNKKSTMCVKVTDLKILGRVGTHIFLKKFFSGKIYIILCILKGISPFKTHKIIFHPRKPEKNSRFHQ